MTYGQRFLLMIAGVAVIFFSLAWCGRDRWEEITQKNGPVEYLLESARSQPVELPLCMDEATREQIRAVMLEALDNSLKNHIEHVFEIWLKDATGQPARARTGVQQGVKAYLGARQSTVEWAPPVCAG